ncbi:glycoside hydrolase family 3 protein [Glycomyces algeriensis]|uniref:Exo-alpha-(1->6)-L-arabinopyranosidase n=1 Tax=Glycomyces algeriensis TaxID=256037 RepID=A0A9W6GCL2_9ACTN|nr:glycoside hydrolase family 3 protein [Glycomyces algeriensis]MDA1366732.1 glycoside hydrolase family 3 C-terminal domain-containing protein [Glycomyces algeriensis]MDR7351619.1 beta-glucosidase [Glycomyces algeriensis]GLI44342.1 beta-glucosidase [Glycomyces algeriensis]
MSDIDPRPAFRDPNLPRAERVADLLSRLTLDEKIGLLHQYHRPVERLGMGPFKTGTEALHGLAWLGEATVFPQVVALGATWNPELVEQIGAAVADEVLAFNHNDPVKVGRNVWAPTVNPLRDPRWGRNEEGYSEDAGMAGLMGAAYARGLKGDNGSVWKTAPSVKHFLAYGNEADRCTTSSNMPPRVLREYEFAAHRPALASGDAVAVMLSYNLVNGRPAHVTPLVNSELRTWTDEEVYIVSDAYAPNNLANLQGYFEDLPTAYAAAVKAGLDSFTQDDENARDVLVHVETALERGLLDEGDIDTAVRRNLHVRFGLGEFDPEDPYAHIGDEAVNSPEHQALAREAAAQSITLLKNDGILPLAGPDRQAPKKIAVLGPFADTQMQDWYSGTLPYAVTARQALGERAEVVYSEAVDRVRLRHRNGYVTAVEDGKALEITDATGAAAQYDLFDWGGWSYTARNAATGLYVDGRLDGTVGADSVGPHEFDVHETFRIVELEGGKVALQQIHVAEGAEGGKWYALEDGRIVLSDDRADAVELDVELVVKGHDTAAELARDADVAIVVLGDHPLVNGRETEDRTDLRLANAQEWLLKRVQEANPNTILVMSSSYPYAANWAEKHVRAVAWSGHGGQEWGNALADVLYGDRDPEGRLPQTWYTDAAELPAMLDYDIVASDATYLYYLGQPLYPFGHGLSYAEFKYANLKADKENAKPGDELTVTVEVTNTSGRDGVETVQLYTHQCGSRVKQPLRQLRRFEKVRLAAGETRTVTFTVPVDELAHWDNVTGRMIVEKSRQRLMVGRSATDIVLSASVRVDGETVGARDLSQTLKATANDLYEGVLWRDENRTSGDVIAAEEAGGWIMLGDCDFGSAEQYPTVTARVAGQASQLTLRVDDPLDGDVLAKIDTPATNGVYDYTDVTVELGRIEGVKDLYVAFESGPVRLASLSFAAEHGGAA